MTRTGGWTLSPVARAAFEVIAERARRLDPDGTPPTSHLCSAPTCRCAECRTWSARHPLGADPLETCTLVTAAAVEWDLTPREIERAIRDLAPEGMPNEPTVSPGHAQPSADSAIEYAAAYVSIVRSIRELNQLILRDDDRFGTCPPCDCAGCNAGSWVEATGIFLPECLVVEHASGVFRVSQIDLHAELQRTGRDV